VGHRPADHLKLVREDSAEPMHVGRADDDHRGAGGSGQLALLGDLVRVCLVLEHAGAFPRSATSIGPAGPVVHVGGEQIRAGSRVPDAGQHLDQSLDRPGTPRRMDSAFQYRKPAAERPIRPQQAAAALPWPGGTALRTWPRRTRAHHAQPVSWVCATAAYGLPRRGSALSGCHLCVLKVEA
jgi:hypothetical protein